MQSQVSNMLESSKKQLFENRELDAQIGGLENLEHASKNPAMED